MENSERIARGVEIRRASNLSRRALLRLFVQPNSGLSRLAPHAARGARGRRSRGRLDLGGAEDGRRDGPSRAAIYFAGFAATANILVPTGTIMGERLAYLPSAGFCLLLALGWNWLRTKERDSGLGITRRDCFGFVRADRGAKPGLEGRFCSVLLRCAGRPERRQNACQSRGSSISLRNQLDLAAREYQIALRILPDSAEALSSYSALEFQRGNYQAAGQMMEKALSMSGRNNLNYDFMVVTFAAILMKTNHADRALEYLNREIAESPLYAPAWSTRAELHYQQGEFAAARDGCAEGPAPHSGRSACAGCFAPAGCFRCPPYFAALNDESTCRKRALREDFGREGDDLLGDSQA